MSRIGIVDVSLRDGNQSLWGAVGLRTPHVLQLAPMMDRVGFRALDFTSSTHMGISVRTHRENPWERIRRTATAMPNTMLQFIGTGFRFISWERLHPEVMALAYERLVANGMSRFVVLDPMHDMDAVRATARSIRLAGAREIIGALTYTVSDVHDDAYYAGLAAQMAACPDIDRVYVKDPTGLLTPERARSLIPAIRASLADTPLELHSHCTLGLSPRSYLDAADLGVEVLQVACGPLSNGTSLPDAQQTVANLREHGHTVDLDDRLLGEVAGYLADLAAAESRPVGVPTVYDASFLRHQVAGGVMTTMRRQLAELGLEPRFDEVMVEVGRVRAELGYPIMVTPFPQMVCSQALYNVIDGERYHNVSDQVIRYVLGSFGAPTVPIDAEVEDRILARRRAKELRDEPPPPSLAELRSQFRRGIDDEELLLRATMPEGEVDAMVAAGPAAAHYNPRLQPVLELLRRLHERPAVADLQVTKPGFALALRGRRGDAASPDADRSDGGRRVAAVPPEQRLAAARGFVFDMDGTLVLGDRRNQGLVPLPGALELGRWLAERSLPSVVVTNGTTRTPHAYAQLLRDLGFPVLEDGLLTPASGAVEVLRERGCDRVLVLGGEGLAGPVREAGMQVVAPTGRPRVDAVLVGWYPQFTLAELEVACHAVWGGARLYSASQSLFFATAEGRTLGTSRAICSMIESVTGCAPELVGKPALHMLRGAARRLGLDVEDLVVVGDDPALEVRMARHAGALAVAVDTGVGRRGDAGGRPEEEQADLHLDGVGDLLALLERLHA